MKLLKIEKQQGYYRKNDDYKLVDSITKEDILALLKKIYEEDSVEFDEIDDGDNRITMPSQDLIYSKLYEKLVELKDKKEEITASVDAEFMETREKYCTD